MNVDVKRIGDATVVSPAGRIDAITAGDLQRTLDDLLGQDATRLALDFAEVSYISTAGLRVVIQTVKRLHGRGHVAISGLNGPVGKVFELVGFTSVLPIFGDLESAIASVSVSDAPRAP